MKLIYLKHHLKEKPKYIPILSLGIGVQIARLQERPTTLDYIPYIFDSFIELHGDRNFRDDPAMIGGIGYLNGTLLQL